jgi:multidrug efflux pump subunit AcrA (membrane-fusion protein)
MSRLLSILSLAVLTAAPAVGETFEPRDVRVGERADGQAVILSGVAAGERIAVRANFLLDSESRLRAAIASAAPPGGGAQ